MAQEERKLVKGLGAGSEQLGLIQSSRGSSERLCRGFPKIQCRVRQYLLTLYFLTLAANFLALCKG